MPVAQVSPATDEGRVDSVPAGFVCSWTYGGLDAAWMRVAGELDSAATPRLERALRETQSQALLLVLDLRALTFIDTCGANAIAQAGVRAQQLGRRLVLLRGPASVDRVFSVTGSSAGLEVVDLNQGEPAVQALLQLAALAS